MRRFESILVRCAIGRREVARALGLKILLAMDCRQETNSQESDNNRTADDKRNSAHEKDPRSEAYPEKSQEMQALV